MVNKILKKDKLSKFAEEIMKKHVLYAPVMKNDAPMFKKISDPKEITLTSLNTVISPKDIFFRQTEPMFSYELGKEKSITPIEPAEKAVVLGIRPCDAKSLSVIDAVFCQDYVDDYYFKRRENSILIGLTCNEPGLNCFCTSVGGSPS